MTDIEQVALENFLFNIDCLNELNSWIDEINIFEILKMSKMEIRHSNFLAWLLNPNENHSFGNRILKDIICHLVKHKRADINQAFNIFNATTLWDYESFNVYREKDNIDILIVSDTSKVLICIENKVFSQEHGEQTIRYRNKIDESYPNYNKLFIFLTPDGDEAIDYEYWVPLSYRELIEIIKTNMELKSFHINEKEKIFIENYISGVKRHMMDDMNLQEVCSKIYNKHKQALDLIFENKPDLRGLIYTALVEKLEKDENIELYKNASTKASIRFNTSYSLKLFPKLIEPRKSNLNTDLLFHYEINNRRGHPLRFYAVMINNGLLENELLICKNVCTIIDKKPLKDIWQYKVFNLSKHSKMIKVNLNEMTDEEFNDNKVNIVNDLFDNIMKAVNEFENKLKKGGL